MPLSTFISKLNWRLIAVHFAACWFFCYASQELFILHDFKFIIPLRFGKIPPNIDWSRLQNDLLWLGSSNLTGLMAGLLVSLFIVIKKRWFWLNSLIAFLMAYLIWRLHVSGWNFLYHIFLLPGRVVKDDNSRFYLINGIFLFTIGALLFSLGSFKKFINIPPKEDIEAIPQPSGT